MVCELAFLNVRGTRDSQRLVLAIADRPRHLQDPHHATVPETTQQWQTRHTAVPETTQQWQTCHTTVPETTLLTRLNFMQMVALFIYWLNWTV